MIERAKIVQTSGKHAKSRRIFAALARVPLVLAPRNVGAPLVTPVDGTARPPRHPHPPRSRIFPPASPGDMNVAPTIDWTPSPGKRRGATCDARRRNGTSEPPSAPTVFPHNSACQPGDMNVAPTIEWTPSPGKRRGATCDARKTACYTHPHHAECCGRFLPRRQWVSINETPAGIDGRWLTGFTGWLTGISGWLTETAGRLAGKMGARSVAAGGASV